MSYLRINRPMSAEEKRKALSAAANDILRLRICDVDPNTPDRRKSRGELKAKKRAKLLASGKLERFPGIEHGRPDQGVYVIGAPGLPVKIGIASNVTSRLSGIQVGCPERLRIYLFIDALDGIARDVERECHRRLDQYRVSGEWFNLDWRDAAEMVRKVIGDLKAKTASA